MVRGPAVKARFNHRRGNPWEDRAPHDFDSTEPFVRRSPRPYVRAIEFVNIVVPELFLDITLDGLGTSIV